MIDRDFFTSFTAQQQHLEAIASLANASDDFVANRSKGLDDAWILAIAAALTNYARTRAELEAESRATAEAVVHEDAHLAELRQRPAPTYGSRDAAAFAAEVQGAERAIDAARKRDAEIDHVLRLDDHPGRDLVAEVRQGTRRILPLVLVRIAHRTVADITETMRNGMGGARALAQIVTDRLNRYEATCRRAAELAGQPVSAPVIHFPDRAAWAAVAQGHPPTVVAASPPAPSESPRLTERVRQAIAG